MGLGVSEGTIWGELLRVALRRCRNGVILLWAVCAPANASVIDGIEVAPLGSQTQITIRFATEIQYLRHAPDREGRQLRIFFRLTKPGFAENELMQEVRSSPKTKLAPPFTLIYPELVNAMLVSFARSTSFTVRPGNDSRSIVILLPQPADSQAATAVPATVQVATAAPPEPATGEMASSPAPATEGAAALLLRNSAALHSAAPAEKEAGMLAGPPAPAKEGTAALLLQNSAALHSAAPAEKEGTAVPLPAAQVEERAANFLRDAREALAQRDYPRAINRLNRVLGLPANAQTIAAQALLGEAREKNGEILKAKAEYELFLKLYPEAAEAPAIRTRLAALPAEDVSRRATVRAPVRDDRPAEWTVNSSVSSYLFTGRSAFDGGRMQRDQESAISSVGINARLRDGASDTRIVFRDTDSRNFLQPSRNYNRIYTAYAERSDRDIGYSLRLGRQNPNGAGVLERFDGISGSFTMNGTWKLGGVLGSAVEFGSPFRKTFYGASVELLPQLARPGVSLYAIEQNLDGHLNRRALGSEVRYFDGQLTGYGMLDYDLLYQGINIGMMQANYLDNAGNNYFLSYDYRQTPSYSLTNALATAGYTTVDEMIGNLGARRSRQLAKETTALSEMFAAGMTIPVGERWQLGLDYRRAETSGTNAQIPLSQMCKELQDDANPSDPLCVDGPRGTLRISEMGLCVADSYDMITKTCLASSAASGRTHMVSAQAVGTNLLVANGVGVIYLGYVTGETYRGRNLGISYVLPIGDNWRLEGNARYYGQSGDDGSRQRQYSPSLKLTRQLGDFSIESELGYSVSRTTGPAPGKYRRQYLYLGMRWDLR